MAFGTVHSELSDPQHELPRETRARSEHTHFHPENRRRNMGEREDERMSMSGTHVSRCEARGHEVSSWGREFRSSIEWRPGSHGN